MVDDRGGTTLEVTAEPVWDLTRGDLGLDVFAVAVAGPGARLGNHHLRLRGRRRKGTSFFVKETDSEAVGSADSPVLVGLRDGEERTRVWPRRSDASELGAVQGRNDIEGFGGADRDFGT